MPRILLIGFVIVAAGSSFVAADDESRSAKTEREGAERLFATQVLPLLRQKCFACHGEDPKDLRGALDVRSLPGLLAGGESGEPAIVPGDPDESLLVQAIEWRGYEMPPKENDRLSPAQIAAVRAWIAAGAPWPKRDRIEALLKKRWDQTDGVTVSTSGGLSPEWTNRRYDPSDLWAYRPVGQQTIPATTTSAANPIDAFLNSAAAAAGLAQASTADRRTLIRRLTFDLTGLPPTQDAIDEFLADASPNAYEKLVDRLLASPHYGEQAARIWLDVTRYADSAGFSNDFERPHAWRYRDYAIRSFNADKPFDRFIVEQLAGDELDPDDPEMLIAVGFLRMGPWEHTGMSVAAVTRQQFLDDVTNSVGETFLATNMSCCRCHDHKFDPIPTRDYYRLQAVFAPVQFAHRDAPFLPEENIGSLDRERDRIQALLEDEQALHLALEVGATNQQRAEAELALRKLNKKRTESFQRELQRFKPLAMSVYNGPPIERRSNNVYHPIPRPQQRSGDPQEVFILTGGAFEAPGEKVEPGVLSVIGEVQVVGRRSESNESEFVSEIDSDSSPIPTTLDGRRLALARWIASPENPLTARVFVNRVWQQHFGTGIAANPNNFGKMGKRPSHPELLDWLAREFVRGGWRVKALHRLIVTSEAYRRSGIPPDADAVDRVDPENRLLTWYPPRRLTAEEIRDAALVASGELNREMGGFPSRPEINLELAFQPRHVMGSVTPAYQPSRTPAERNRRSIYSLKIRTLRDPTFEVFDQPTPDLSCERRTESTVAPQAFALFNGQASHDRAIAMAIRVEREAASLEERIVTAFQLVFGRPPSNDEVATALKHVLLQEVLHRQRQLSPKPLPRQIERSLVEEQTGTEIRWTERLDVYEDYVPHAKPWDVPPETRALADLCLVLLNANEFLYVY